MKVRIVIEPDEGVFTAYCPELKGCATFGKTEAEALENIKDAIELYLRPSLEVNISADSKVFELVV